jgi:hypothetical protein
MASSPIPDRIRRIFTETFTARDLAEPLASFDANAACADVRSFMEARDFDVVGIRCEGKVVGYVEREALSQGPCESVLRPLETNVMVDEETPLATALTALTRTPFLLVQVLGDCGGIITRADIQKAPVRMWLFGMVTMIEMRFSDLIEHNCPGDSWQQYLSEARLQKAQSLLEERRRRRQSVRLFDCLQFADKGRIIARNENVRKFTIFASRGQAEDAVKKLEQLRNNLAHAQDLPTSDWEIIARLCELIAEQ